MDDDRLKDFKELKYHIGEQKKTVDNVIVIKQDNIDQEAKTIGELRKSSSNYSYLGDILNDVPEAVIQGMDDDEYSAFTGPARDTVYSGEVVVGIYDETRKSNSQFSQHYSVCASLDQVTRSGTSGYMAFSNANPGYFPNKTRIESTYKVEDSLFADIGYIRDYFNRNLPDVVPDFEYFVDKYNAFQRDSSQYQDLIGSRSMFFFKVIFEFSKNSYGVDKPRPDAIRKFVFGSAAPIPSAEPIIRKCYNLWRELSSQDDPTQSIKIGKVTPPYIESTFRRIIGDIASLLKLRETSFTP